MTTNYNGWIAYKKSKLCNILFTKKLSELTKKNKITVNFQNNGKQVIDVNHIILEKVNINEN